MSAHAARAGLVAALLSVALPSIAFPDTSLPTATSATSASRAGPGLMQERKALLALQEQSRQRVAALVRELQVTPRGPEWWRLQRRIAEAKRQGQRELLLARLEFARRRNDAVAADDIQRALADLDAPRPVPPASGAPAESLKPIPPAEGVRHDR